MTITVTKVLKLICCNVFQREACACMAQSPHVIDVEFTELGEHANSGALRAQLQARIDATGEAPRRYDAILLLFGLCGNATAGLTARTIPLVIPRAHDCCTILLGSRGAFQQHFGDAPSTPFSSSGYIERGQYFLRTEDGKPAVQSGDAFAELVEKYGPEDAQYIWEQMHPTSEDRRAVFIDLPETSHLGHVERFREKALAAGKEPLVLQGSSRLIRNLLNGDWDAEEFLTVAPGQQIRGVYDFQQVMRAEDPPSA